MLTDAINCAAYLVFQKFWTELLNMMKFIKHNEFDVIVRISAKQLDVNANSQFDCSGSGTDLHKGVCAFIEHFIEKLP